VKRFFAIFFFILIFGFIFFYLFKSIIADTGFYFAYDYLINKLELDNTKNKISLKNYKNTIINEKDTEYKFENILGFKNKYKELNHINYKPANEQLIETEEWLRSNGGNFSNKFSNIKHINSKNVRNLNLEFKINFNDTLIKKKWKNNVETNPVFYEGLLYVVTPFKELVAINILNKKIEWEFKSLKKIDSRGITLWINKENKNKSCLFVPIRNGLFCVNYKSGKLNKSLGVNGFIKTGTVRAAPVIWKDFVIVATIDDQKVKLISLKTGKIMWVIDIHPKERNFEGGSPWGGISIDTKNNLLFLTTGNPRPALIGHSRPGKNKNANSVIAIDLNLKKIVWSFQEVAHDLWDYDIASPPLLTNLRLNDQLVDVVIITTKIGNTFIFDRYSGKSFNDINYKFVQKSDYIYENVSPKQVYINIPEPLIDLNFSEDDLDDRLLDEQANIIKNINNFKFGTFVPPSFEKDVVVYGLHGGAQWPGAVFDPYKQNIYVQVNQIPWLLRLFVTSKDPHPKSFNNEFEIYQESCSSCHKADRTGNYSTVDEKNINYVPSLIKIFDKNYKNYNHFINSFNKAHKIELGSNKLKQLFNLFINWDQKILKSNNFTTNFQWSQFLYSDDLPVSKPPWGKIVSLNLLNGKIDWEIPSGYLNSKQIGTSNFGGLIATAGNLIFSTGTNDKKIVAIDSSNGKELWSYEMVAAGSTAPITFEINEKQYIAVMASGGRYHNYSKKYGELYVFSLL
tara:strand:- start:17851 stop:20064 length:2214 start_codon:yes stop_codon:yes gene_type:complete